MDKVKELAKMIDHSILHPTMTDQDLRRECDIARKYDVASVCVKPYAVKDAVKFLKGSEVLVGCVIGFPHGNSSTEVKVFETEKAIADGAIEIDMVVNIGKVLGGQWDYVEDEIAAIACGHPESMEPFSRSFSRMITCRKTALRSGFVRFAAA